MAWHPGQTVRVSPCPPSGRPSWRKPWDWDRPSGQLCPVRGGTAGRLEGGSGVGRGSPVASFVPCSQTPRRKSSEERRLCNLTVPLLSLGHGFHREGGSSGWDGLCPGAWGSGSGRRDLPTPPVRPSPVRGAGPVSGERLRLPRGSSPAVASSSHPCVRMFQAHVCLRGPAGCACSHMCVGGCPCG